MIKNSFIILSILISLNFFLEAKIDEYEVLTSTSKYYPMILEAMEDVEGAKMKVVSSLGEFDLKIKSKGDVRTRGFYDGKSGDIKVVKPLQFMNSEVYTGYRVSDGIYPDYEGKVDTLTDGEVRAGIKVSLWQNRDIDEQRLDLWNNRLNTQIKTLKLVSTRLKMQKQAQKAYWSWYAYGHIFGVHKELLQIAISRDDAISQRIKRGDLAKIYSTENRQYILKRSQKVLEAERDFFEASLYLSLFYRDKEGRPIMPLTKDLPKLKIDVVKLDETLMKKDTNTILNSNPELLSMEQEYQQLSNEELQGKNKLAPKIDLRFEVSHDNGRGSKTLRPTENRAMVAIEIPLERRLGRGKLNKARAEKRALEHRRRLVRDQMLVFIKNIYKRIALSVDFVKNAVEEVTIAEKLRKAEQTKFFNGASDFFVVNIRDQNMADAKVRKIKAYLSFKKDMAEYNEATMRFLRN